MASPTVESLCCLTSSTHFSKEFLVDFHTIYYNLVSILSSLLGIGGALYQIFRKDASNGSNISKQQFRTRGRIIIKWLALADLMAACGILVRSISWISDKSFGASENDSILGQVFCVLTSGWIHYFYTATYFWTLIYALDVKFVLQNKKINHKIYHFIGWTFPFVLCLVGLLFLYLPDLNCYNRSVNPYWRFLPNYLSTFIPILLVMIANPLLYCVAFSSVEKLLVSSTGRFTQRERDIIGSLKLKFMLINVVFYICWLPNILNGIILWSDWMTLPKMTLIVIWYLMAVLNPLQAVLNCFVYRSWETKATSRSFWFHSKVWLEERVSSSSQSKSYLVSSSSQSKIYHEREARSSETNSDDTLDPNAFLNPWLSISLSESSSRRPSERTPLLTSTEGRPRDLGEIDLVK